MTEEKTDKYQIIYIVIILVTALLIFNLAKLQLFDPYYSRKASATTLNQNTIYPSRGLFYDRNGKLLVINYPAYDLFVTYKDVPKHFDTTSFCSLLNITKQKFIENLNKDWSSGKYSKSIPFIFLKNIDSKTFLKFSENLYAFKGFYPELRSVREYPEPHGANFLGYTSEVTKSDIENANGLYQLGDYIGCAGLEKEYEESIRGNKGVQFVLKDNLGREVGPFENGNHDKNAISGLDVMVSIDMDLQQYGEALMKNKVGSIVAIEPSTGEILCLVSAPSYDPNLLSIHPERGKAYAWLLRDSLKPLFDRSASAKYPPGSIFKPILALIALQEKVLFQNTSYNCKGAYYYKTVSYGCHIHPYTSNLTLALQHSCNSYFIQSFRDLIEKDGFTKPNIGLDLLVKYLGYFGLGKPLYSDVATENGGFIPTSDYYTRIYKTDQWRSTYIVSVGIGQGELQLTTLQMANLAVAIANRGYFYTPHLIRAYKDPTIPIPEKYLTKNKIPIDAKYFVPVIEGMQLAVSSGTATLAYHPEIEICGKTGTSQNPHGEDHSVFFAFAPKINPKIAIAVYVENAGWGGSIAAPIASLMIEKYLRDSVTRTYLEEKMFEKDLIHKKKT
ncbi:MAG: penicillin-binding transpeptidase domain-containing protein [Bacteroidota bacterium]|nr:penicillin-binding transpeptidase domain-containing protein [Bacteroidota bacterium]